MTNLKKLFYIALISLGFQTGLYAQLETKGWWTRDLFTFRSDFDPDGAGVNQSRTTGRFLTQPEVGYALNKRFLVGLITQYSHTFQRQDLGVNGSGLLRSDDRFLGAGPLFRYFIPLGSRVSLMPEVFFVYYGGKRSFVTLDNGLEQKSSSKYNSIGTGAFPSLVCFLTRDLALSLTVASVQYYSTLGGGHTWIVEFNPQQWLLGVEYYFEKKSAKKAAK